MLLAIDQISKQKKLGVLLSISLVGIGCLVSFPLMIEEVARRVGPEYINLGTGMVFFTAQLSVAILTYSLGFVLDRETKIEALYALFVTLMIFSLSFVLSVGAECLNKNKFVENTKKGVVEAQKEEDDEMMLSPEKGIKEINIK